MVVRAEGAGPRPEASLVDELRSNEAVYRLTPRGDGPLLLGRRSSDGGPRPDIDLNGEFGARTVSREHLLLTPRDGGWAVQVAPNTVNLTRVNGLRLLPGQEAMLHDEDTLQVGEVTLTLYRVALAEPDIITVQVDTPEFTIAPGEAQQLTVSVANHTGRVERFHIEVDGIPASWVRLTLPDGSSPSGRASLYLLNAPPGSAPTPESRQRVSLLIQPPREADAHAGVYPIRILATTSGQPALRGVASAELHLRPFEQAAFALTPEEQIGPTATFYVDFENTGNAATTLAVKATAEGVRFAYEPPLAGEALPVAPGATARVAVHATVARRHWMGVDMRYNLWVSAEAGALTPPPQHAQLLVPPRVPAWAQTIWANFYALLSPVILLVLILLAAYLFVRPPDIHTFQADVEQGRRVTIQIALDRRCADLELDPGSLVLVPAEGGPRPQCSAWDRLVDGFPWAADTTRWEATGKLDPEPASYSVTAKNMLGVGNSRSVTVPGAQVPKILTFEVDPLRPKNEAEQVSVSWTTQDAHAVKVLRLDTPPGGEPELRDLSAPMDGLSGSVVDNLRHDRGEYILLAAIVDEFPADDSPALERIRPHCEEAREQTETCIARLRFHAAAEAKFAQCKPKFLRGELCSLPDVVMRSIRATVSPPEILAFTATPDATNPGSPIELRIAVQNATSITVSAKDPNAPPASLAQAAAPSLPAAASALPLSPMPVVRRSLDGLEDGGGDPQPTATPATGAAPPTPSGSATPGIPPASATPAPRPVATPSPTAGTACDRTGVWEVQASPFTLSVAPRCDTAYELVATNAGGTVRQTVVVKVTPISITVFTAAPASIPLGGEATLSWSVGGATTLEISSLGAVTGENTRVVKPEVTTDYVLTAFGRDRLGPSQSRTVRVTVGLPAAKIDLFAAAPPTVLVGESTVLTFSAQNARRVTIAASDGTTVFDQTGQPSVQRSLPISPRQTTVYTLTVNSDSGPVTAAVTVTVLPLPTATPAPSGTPAAAGTPSPVASGTPGSGTPTPSVTAEPSASPTGVAATATIAATGTPAATATPAPLATIAGRGSAP